MIKYLWADDQYERLPALAADLVRRRVNVIVAATTPAALAAKRATKTIPIVFAIGGDPVGTGLVDSVSRPGNNLTGAAHINVDTAPKRLELLHELVPTEKVIGLLLNPTNPLTKSVATAVQAASQLAGTKITGRSRTHRRRARYRFCELARHTFRSSCNRYRSILYRPNRKVGRNVPSLQNACDPSVSRIHSGRRRNELWRQHNHFVSYSPVSMSAGFSRARSRPISPSNCQRRSICSSISKAQKNSASRVPRLAARPRRRGD